MKVGALILLASVCHAQPIVTWQLAHTNPAASVTIYSGYTSKAYSVTNDIGTNRSIAFTNPTWGKTLYLSAKATVGGIQSTGFTPEVAVPIDWKGQRIVTMGASQIAGPWADLPKLTRTNIVWPANGLPVVQFWRQRIEVIH